MEKVKRRSLKRSFMKAVAVTEAKLRYVLDGPPEPFGQLVKDGQECNEAQEQTSYRIERIESNYSMLSSKAKTACRASQICTEVHRSEVELPDFLHHMADSLSILFQNTEMRFSCNFHVPAGRAVLDGELLYRVLENLISNALRFAEHQINLAFYLEHGTLSATVTDDGPGFSEKLLQKKTALFYSEDASGKHLGLGLAVSRVLCQKHGGTIELSDRPPHGACAKATITVNRFLPKIRCSVLRFNGAFVE